MGDNGSDRDKIVSVTIPTPQWVLETAGRLKAISQQGDDVELQLLWYIVLGVVLIREAYNTGMGGVKVETPKGPITLIATLEAKEDEDG